jgi:protein-S-isoprenylcysteine O-methyltransferase Ste14
MTKPHILELRVLPVVVFLLAILGIWVSAWFTPAWSFAVPWEFQITTVFSAIGVLLGIGGVGAFARARTTTNPLNPEKASTIVSSGAYRISRNPMYLGLFMFLIALTIKLGNPTGIVFLPAFVIYMSRFQIEPEERVLLEQFGDEYAAYKSRVRRWI